MLWFFDFRAHGESSKGQCCTLGRDEVNDIFAAVNYIKSDKRLNKLPLMAYAFSMGAVASIIAQSQDGSLFDCAIWDCPFESTEDLLRKNLNELTFNILGFNFCMPGIRFLKKYAYNKHVQLLLLAALKTISQADNSAINTHILPVDVSEAIKKVTIPAFFITCRNDKKSSPKSVKKVYEGARGFKRLWITEGRWHFDSYFSNPEKYEHKVKKFFRKFLKGEFKNKVQQKVLYDLEIDKKIDEK